MKLRIALLIAFAVIIGALALSLRAQTQTSMTVTLTAANTNYNLRTLLIGVDSRVVDNFTSITFTAADANIDMVLVGDSSLSASRFGFNLGPGDSYTSPSRDPNDLVHPSLYYLRSATAGMVVHFIGRTTK